MTKIILMIAIFIVLLGLIQSIKEKSYMDTIGYICYLLARCVDGISTIMHFNADMAIILLDITAIVLLLRKIIFSIFKCLRPEP